MSSVVFIDSRVSDPGQLLAGLAADVQVVYRDSMQDGVGQIVVAALTGATGLDSIHVFSRGSIGTLHFGSAVLTGENLVGICPGSDFARLAASPAARIESPQPAISYTTSKLGLPLRRAKSK